MNTSEIIEIWLPLVVAGLVQASFSLGVSMLTLLSSHVMAAPEAVRRLTRLSLAYIAGSWSSIVVGLVTAIYCLASWPGAGSEQFWALLTGASVGTGLAILLFYYRWSKQGTQLWLPRRAAEYLHQRTKATRRPFEAMILGIGAILAELIFIAAPLLIAANLAAELNGSKQIAAIGLYSLIAILPLILLLLSNAGGRKISAFQCWRERNKRFLQVMAGVLLIVLGTYLLTYKALGVAT
jgi:cytochrome c biogenesis protein CcdA